MARPLAVNHRGCSEGIWSRSDPRLGAQSLEISWQSQYEPRVRWVPQVTSSLATRHLICGYVCAVRPDWRGSFSNGQISQNKRYFIESTRSPGGSPPQPKQAMTRIDRSVCLFLCALCPIFGFLASSSPRCQAPSRDSGAPCPRSCRLIWFIRHCCTTGKS